MGCGYDKHDVVLENERDTHNMYFVHLNVLGWQIHKVLDGVSVPVRRPEGRQWKVRVRGVI